MYAHPPWVNVDIYRPKRRGRFVQASGTALPFADDTFTRIHAIHVLEHLPRKSKNRDGFYTGHVEFLREMARVLAGKGAGYAFVEVPDFLSVARLLVAAADRGDHEECRIRTVGVYGKARHAGDHHDWGFTAHSLEALLNYSGLRCRRDHQMISGHYRQEPVLLYRCWRG